MMDIFAPFLWFIGIGLVVVLFIDAVLALRLLGGVIVLAIIVAMTIFLPWLLYLWGFLVIIFILSCVFKDL